MKRLDGLVRWYPEGWRRRYGEEYLALMEDLLAGEKPGLRFSVSVAWAGLVERSHAVGLVGSGASSEDRRRSGSLLVLWAWAAFGLGGCALAKTAEHTGAAHWLAAIQGLGLLSILVVLAAALVAVPAALRLFRADRWSSLAPHLRRAAAATMVAGAGLFGLVRWAHALPRAQVESGSGWYGAAFIAVLLIVSATVALWTGAAVAAVRRLDLAPATLRVESRLSALVCAAMLATTIAAFEWVAHAHLGLAPDLAAIGFVFVAADSAAVYGVARARTI